MEISRGREIRVSLRSPKALRAREFYRPAIKSRVRLAFFFFLDLVLANPRALRGEVRNLLRKTREIMRAFAESDVRQ